MKQKKMAKSIFTIHRDMNSNKYNKVANPKGYRRVGVHQSIKDLPSLAPVLIK